MKIRIRTGAVYSRISNAIPDELSDFLDDVLSEWEPNAIFSTSYIEKNWDGYNRYYNKETKIFRTGLLSKVITYVMMEGHEVSITDDRPSYDHDELDIPYVFLKPEQDKAVDAIIEHKRGIIEAPVRFGKTIISIELARRLSLFPFLFVSQEITPASQALKKFQKWLPNHISFGFCGDGEVGVGDVTVSTIQTLAHALSIIVKRKELTAIGIKYVEKPLKEDNKKPLRALVEEAKVIVLDEAHHGISRIHQEFLKKPRRAEIIVGLSATIPETLKLERALGPVIYSISFQEATEKGYILPAKIYWYQYEDPRDQDFRLAEYPEIYQKCITENPHRNGLIVKIAKSAVKQKNSVVITVLRKKHGELLESMIPKSAFIWSKHSKDARDNVIKELENGKRHVIISTLIKEAVDIPSLSMVINAAGGDGFIGTIQKIRSITPDPNNPNKKVGKVVDFLDRYKYLKDHSKHRLKEYKERGFEIVKRKIK